MPTSIAFIMDPIQGLNSAKDSTLAMAEKAQALGWTLFSVEINKLYVKEGQVYARGFNFSVDLSQDDWYQSAEWQEKPLKDFDVVMMRKDPPFDMHYIYATYLLELAANEGVLVLNNPASIRNANEKLFTLQFPQCTSPCFVGSDQKEIRAFLQTHKDIILKPLDGMGGSSIFRVKEADPNISVIIETLTQFQTMPIMAQRFIPEIVDGDKRILMINGQPVPFSLARIPAKGETRGNLAAGGSGRVQPLSDRDLWIAHQVGPSLKTMGLMFVGLDVIGDYLTEINVTSPTCIREISKGSGFDVVSMLFDEIIARLAK